MMRLSGLVRRTWSLHLDRRLLWRRRGPARRTWSPCYRVTFPSLPRSPRRRVQAASAAPRCRAPWRSLKVDHQLALHRQVGRLLALEDARRSQPRAGTGQFDRDRRKSGRRTRAAQMTRAAQSLDAAFTTAITSSGWAAAWPSPPTTAQFSAAGKGRWTGPHHLAAADPARGRRAAIPGRAQPVGRLIWRLRANHWRGIASPPVAWQGKFSARGWVPYDLQRQQMLKSTIW
jgi:hypothetical protein